MIKYTEENIFKSKAQALVNPVNGVGIMGKGLALEFKNRYPKMFQSYKDACKEDRLKIGDLQVFNAGEILIINFPTKGDWKESSDMNYIISGLVTLKEHVIPENKIESISMPQIGCGLGGLDWNEVKAVIEKYLADVDTDIYVHIYKGAK